MTLPQIDSIISDFKTKEPINRTYLCRESIKNEFETRKPSFLG